MSVPAEEPAGGGGELNFASSSQHELGAIMVVSNLQFPPLQVMVLSVEDASDGLASCFDLLQKAVMNAHVTLGKLCSLLTGKSVVGSLVYCNTKDNPLQTSGFPIKVT